MLFQVLEHFWLKKLTLKKFVTCDNYGHDIRDKTSGR